MNSFLVRASSALLFVIVFFAGLLINKWTYFLLFLVVLMGCLVEYFQILKPVYKQDKQRVPYYSIFVIIISSIIYSISFYMAQGTIDGKWIYLFPVLVSLVFFAELFYGTKRPFRNIGLTLVSIFYILLPISMCHLLAFHDGAYTGLVILCVMLIIWANDTGAYIIGSMFGKHKIVPSISPKKSVEGYIGGGLLSFLVAFLIQLLISKLEFFSSIRFIPSYIWYIIAAAVFIFASSGDLIESMLKRSLKIKDSGSIMPGHGGFLDRFDAFLYVIPFVVAILEILS